MRLGGRVSATTLALLAIGPWVVRAAHTEAAASGASPIQHIVVIDQENHSFDNVLGWLCVVDKRCDGTTTGISSTGAVIPLAQATDVVPDVSHGPTDQVIAYDRGKMDGFAKISGCGSVGHHRCYSQFLPDQIPNLAALARAFVISDRTFVGAFAGSWGSHLQMVTATLDGFQGAMPKPKSGTPTGPGWGCDSNLVTPWFPPGSTNSIRVPSCVPFPDGSGAFEATPVQWVPTIMDRLDAAGISWKFYTYAQGAYVHSTCPTFADCLYTSQVNNLVANTDVLTDAANGTLPAFSLVVPQGPDSQHNGHSMTLGDNWIGTVVSALQNGPEWNSTAIFITYDDCGCFYDHVPPPAGSGLGLRTPMVIVSPYAKPGFTDSTVASFRSILAFTEHTFGLDPLRTEDELAYDYSNAFDYTQAPLPPVPMVTRTIPKSEREYLATHQEPIDES